MEDKEKDKPEGRPRLKGFTREMMKELEKAERYEREIEMEKA